MNPRHLLLLLLTVCLAGSTALYAQTTGDYRSQQTGNWHDVNTWARFNGTTWDTPASSTPVTADGAVSILSGHTVTLAATDSIDQFTVEAGGKLVVSAGFTLNIEDGTGTDATVNDSLINAGSITLDDGAALIFEDGGVYQHAQNGGTIPTSTWNTGSTCLITGLTGNAPSNANQDFYHFVWNNPGQSSNLNLAWNGNTIGGDVTCISSGSARFQMTNNTYTGTTITINGNVNITGGQLTSNGSSGAATYTINVMGNVTVGSGANFGLSRGSGGNATWNLFGDLTATDATIQTSNASARIVFAKTGTQTATLSGMTYTGTINMTVDTNSTLVVADGPDAVDLNVVGNLVNIGTITPTGAISFSGNATYTHARNGGSVPMATWQSGSTCEVTGVTSTAPSNLNQDFHHFVWNCAGQSSNRDWSWFENTIGGNVTVKSTGTVRAYMTSPGASPLGPNTITVMGDILVEGTSQFSSNGSGSADTITVESFGNLSTSGSGGNVSVSRGSGPVVMWNLYGNLSLDSMTTQNSGTGGKAAFYFVKKGLQSLSLSGTVFSGGGLPIVVKDSSTLDMGVGRLANSGPFLADSGSTVLIGNPGGLDSTFQNTGGTTFHKYAGLGFNGTEAQKVGTPPDTLRSLMFDNAAGITLADSVYAGSLSITAATSVLVDTAGVLQAETGSVYGQILNIGSTSGTAGLTFEDGSVYSHDRNGGTAPTATWAPGSTCRITGATGNSPANLNQNFHHFVWDCPGQTSSLDWAWYNNIIGGNVTVLSSGSARARLTSPGASAPGANVITIVGAIDVVDASLESTGSSSVDTISIHTMGNVTTSGGNFSVSRGSGPNVSWYLNGDITMDGTTTQNSGAAKASFYFVRDGVQKMSLTNVTFGGGGMPIVVGSDATLQLDSSALGSASSTGRFTTAAGAHLTTTHPLGLNGNIPMNDSLVVIEALTDVTYNGSAAQVTGTKLPQAINDLNINNGSGVTLSSAVQVGGTLRFLSGILSIGANTVSADSVAGASSSAYVNTNGAGVLTRPVGAVEELFPVGSGSYAPVWILNSGTADTFRVIVSPEAVPAPHGGRVNMKWAIVENTAGGSDVRLRLGWMGSSETAAFSGNRTGHARIFRVGTDTTEVGTGAYTHQFAAEPYSSSRSGITSFSSFVIGAFGGPVVSAEEVVEPPTTYALGQNYPNPFNPTTKITFDVPTESRVTLEVFDILGRGVETLFDGIRQPGRFDAVFDASHLPSGLYVYRLSTPSGSFTKRMVLMK